MKRDRNSRGARTGLRPLLLVVLSFFSFAGESEALTRGEAMDAILALPEVGDATDYQISMPDTTHGSDVVAWDHQELYPDYPMPYPNTWFAMIDLAPFAGWTHPALWIYLNDDDPNEYEVQLRESMALLAEVGTGYDVPLECLDDPIGHPELLPCYLESSPNKGGFLIPHKLLDAADCVYACIFGANSYGRWGPVVTKGANTFKAALTGAGVPASHITLDTDGTSETDIKNCIEDKCGDMSAEDNLVLYIGSHGIVNSLDLRAKGQEKDAITDENKLEADELKTILGACSDVCRVYVFLEACHSASFLDELDDLGNTIIVSACKSDELANGLNADGSEGGIWGICFSAEIPGKSAKEAHEACDTEVQTTLQTRWAAWCAKNPALCKQTPQYAKGTDVEAENEAIAHCCAMTAVEDASWGKIKALFR